MKLKASNQAKTNKISSKKLSRLSCFKMKQNKPKMAYSRDALLQNNKRLERRDKREETREKRLERD